MHNPLNPTTRRPTDCADRLRRLPQELQPPYNWQEFQRRSRESGVTQSGRSWSQLDWRHLSAAAVLLAVVCGIAIWGRLQTGSLTPSMSLDASSDGGPKSNTGFDSGDIEALREVKLMHRSQDSRAIESWLATLPREPVVVHVGTRAAAARLEDRIAQVDDLLNAERLDGAAADRLVALQQERIRLVGSLAQVRYAEVVASEVP